jgi:glycosyltransferase involved in cell wall biosynthesis
VTKISLVVPTYKESGVIEDIELKLRVLRSIGESFQLIYVFDGFIEQEFRKDTYRSACEFAERNSKEGEQILVLGRYENRGKGYSVREGFEHSAGEYLGFIDFGDDPSVEYVKDAHSLISTDKYDIVIGNKYASKGLQVSFARKVVSKTFLLVVRIFAGLKLPDTQTGIKFFKRDAIKSVLAKLSEDRFAFDVEILTACFRNGFDKIKSFPVRYNTRLNDVSSSVNAKTVFNMLISVIKISYRARIKKIYNQ